MPTKVIYLGEPAPPPHAVSPVLPPLAPGDMGWAGMPLIQPTHPPTPVLPVQSLPTSHPLAASVMHAAPPVTAPYPTYPPTSTQPMLMVYAPPTALHGSRTGPALLWLLVLLGMLGIGVVVIGRIAPERAAQITTALRRPLAPRVADGGSASDRALPSAQNGVLRATVTELTADQLAVTVVNTSDHPVVLSSDAVQLHADDLAYGMPPGVPTVALQPGDAHQIVIRPVPRGTARVLRIQVPGTEALELTLH